MAEPFLSEIRIFSFNFAPRGWALCNGQILSINQNVALFSLLGTTYGGDGRVNFGLPDLRGRAPFSYATGGTPPPGSVNLAYGQVGGQENHTLIATETPIHTHLAVGSTANVSSPSPASTTWTVQTPPAYSNTPANVALSPASTTITGGSQPHPNLSPYLVLNFCIALSGIFPTQN